jgi:hypothetical protein
VKNKIIFLAAVIITITSCNSTGIVPMSQDSYFIGKKDGTPGLGVSLSNKAAVYQEANKFCGKTSREVFVLTEEVTGAAPGRLGSTELTFKCVEPGGTAKALRKSPDTVISIDKNVSISTPETNIDDMYTELKKLKALKDDGIITAVEFETEKQKVLNKY